jgi:hypothetical protein
MFYLFEINPIIIVIISFINGSQNFKTPIKCDFFSTNAKTRYLFEPKVGNKCHMSYGLKV